MFGFGKTKKELAAVKEELQQVRNELSSREEAFLKDFIVGGWSANKIVNTTTAMRTSAVFACVRLISGAISSTRMKIMDGKGKDAIEAPQHPYVNMLAGSPNDTVTAATFWKTMAANKVLNGNAYAVILRGKVTGRPVSLVLAQNVTPYQAYEIGLDEKLGVSPYRLFYSVTWDNMKTTVVDQDDMIHVPNIGWDGKQGLSTLKAGAASINLALSAEESAGALFENGLVSDVALTYPNPMGTDQQEQLRKYIAARHGGASNHHNPLILTEGGKVETLTMNADDAQLIESRQFSVVDIARFFGVPPVMIGETEKTSSWGSGVEQMAKWFVTFNLNNHFTDFEQEIDRKLFRNSNYHAVFDESQLTRGDTKTMAEYNKAAIGGTQNPGWMTTNEIRANLNLPPIDGGNTLFTPTIGEENDDKE